MKTNIQHTQTALSGFPIAGAKNQGDAPAHKRTTMKNTTAYAFLRGIIEFRRSVTSHFPEGPLLDCYERGRDLAHKLTLRAFEDC